MDTEPSHPGVPAPPQTDPAPGVPRTVPDEDVLPALLRYRDAYRWSWNFSKRLINLYFGTDHTEKTLKALYRQNSRA